MKIVHDYSHLGGSEILQVRYPEILAEIKAVIAAVTPTRSKVSREKTMRGRRLYAPRDMNAQFKSEFRSRGFEEARDRYTITIPGSDASIARAYKQVDFVKQKVYVEVQLGKYAFMFYDMAKFQYFYNENKADVGVEIVPAYSLSREMSSGVSYGEQLVYDIERLKRHFPALPVNVLLVDV